MRKKFEPVAEGFKTCCNPRCGRTKPVTEFGIDRTKTDGRKGRCLECVNEAQRKPGSTRQVNIVHVRESDGFMNCTHPEHVGDVWLPPERFAKDSSKKRGRRTHCKDCVRRRDGYEKERIPAETRPDGRAKACARCEIMLDLHEFNVNPRGVLGRDSACKACLAGLDRNEYDAKILYECLIGMQKKRALLVGEYVCLGCGSQKRKDEFKSDVKSPVGISARCRECLQSETGLEWRRMQTMAIVNGCKVCYICEETKDELLFEADPQGLFGISDWCSDCEREHRMREQRRERVNEKYADNDLFRMVVLIRVNVKNQLKRGGWDKDSSTHEYLGCSYEFFKAHLDAGKYDFDDPDMDLDHVIPSSWATTETEMAELNRWPNWRVLPAGMNKSKKDLVPDRSLLHPGLSDLAMQIYEREYKLRGVEWTE